MHLGSATHLTDVACHGYHCLCLLLPRRLAQGAPPHASVFFVFSFTVMILIADVEEYLVSISWGTISASISGLISGLVLLLDLALGRPGPVPWCPP